MQTVLKQMLSHVHDDTMKRETISSLLSFKLLMLIYNIFSMSGKSIDIKYSVMTSEYEEHSWWDLSNNFFFQMTVRYRLSNLSVVLIS